MYQGRAATAAPTHQRPPASVPPSPLALLETPTVRSKMTPAEQYRLLEVELDRTKRHMAEVIDEVVFAERCKVDAEAKLKEHREEMETIENILQDMIGYVIAIESSVIVPALDDVTEIIPTGTVAQRARLFSELETIRHVTPRTIRLIATLQNPSESRRDRFRQRREQLMRQSERAPISLDNAYALCALLLDAKEELQLLLAESRDRMMTATLRQKKAMSDDNNNNNSLGAGQLVVRSTAAAQPLIDFNTQRQLEDLRRQVDRVRFDLEASQKEKAMLNNRLNELSANNALPYEKLQQQHYQEKERLQLQVRSLQESEKSSSEKHQYLTGKMEVLTETNQQLREEKKLLQGELKQYRRNEAELSSGQNNLRLQQQQQQRQNADEAQKLRIELDTMMREHSNVVTRLESHNSHLRLELAEVKAQLSHSTSNGANTEYFSQLQRTNDLLRKDLVVLQQRLLSSTGRVTDSNPSFDAKVQAFEVTVSNLTNELGLLERKIHEQEQQFSCERVTMINQMDQERLKSQREKEDYDVLMQRMVDEMEQIVEENKTLKQQISVLSQQQR